MSRTKEQKIKLLVLYDLLCKLSDEEHFLTTNEIISLLVKQGIDVSRKILPNDIALLNEYGYEVLVEKNKSNGYYVVDHNFESAEIAMMSKALKASKLTAGHKERLLDKLGDGMGEHQINNIVKNLVFCDMPKRNNSNILYHSDIISKAISENKQISFRYYSLDENRKKCTIRTDVVNPLVIVWNKDNYYLITYHDRYEGTTTYRIDRMESVEVEETPLVEKAEFANFDIEAYRSQVFSVFGGELVTVELQFVSEMLDDMYDKFGEQIVVLAGGGFALYWFVFRKKRV